LFPCSTTFFFNYFYAYGTLRNVPRRNALSDREVGICRRLREFRLRTGLSCVAFAQKAGVDSSVLVRYEHRRATLKFIHAWKFMRTFLINPGWLFSGEGGWWTRASREAPGPEIIESPEGELFSAVFERVFSKKATAPKKPSASERQLTASELRARYEWSLQHWIRDKLIELPDASVPEFTERLKEAGNALLKKYPKDPPAVVSQRKAKYREELDTDVWLRIRGTL